MCELRDNGRAKKLRDNGDGAKMFNGGHQMSAIEHLRPQAPSKMGPLLYPVPLCPDAFLMGRGGVGLYGQFDMACLSTLKSLKIKWHKLRAGIAWERCLFWEETFKRTA